MAAKPTTRLVQFDAAPGDAYAPLSTPVYQTATFEQPGACETGPYDYTRSGNPTRSVLEGLLADLEGAHSAFAFSSGMAAITAVTRLVEAGGAIVAGDDLYGGTYRLLARLRDTHGIEVRFADTTDPAAVAAALDERTRLLLLETPTNPLMKVSDVTTLAELAHRRGALVAVDNSLLSPYWQRPLALDADIVVQSATKVLSGHGDLTAGVVAVRDPELARQVQWVQNAEGAGLGPFESWLLLRSIKTLAVRLERQEATTRRVAEFLRDHPAVRRLRWPGLEGYPGHGLHYAQARGAGPVLSFETGSETTSQRLVDATRLFKIAVSFGSVVSVISLPCRLSHASIPAEVRRARSLPEGLVRISVGLEDPDDLIEDLRQALERATAEAGAGQEAVPVR